ncbi:MAG: transcriptional regulator, MarR family, partial [Pelosinus sp.]|nr:transcriptional regulator, MarR family [Pelosinus sp.]
MKDKYIVYFISRTKQKMVRFIEEQLQENGLHDLIPSHGNILTALFENQGKLSMKKIAEIIGKDKSTLTPLVNKLVELDYIIKEQNQLDKRVTYIILTSKGKQMQEKFSNISDEVYKAAYKGFSAEEKD